MAATADAAASRSAYRAAVRLWLLRAGAALVGVGLGASCPWWPPGAPRAICEGVAHVLRLTPQTAPPTAPAPGAGHAP